MADDRALIKKDLLLILRLNSKLHYNNKDDVQKIYNVIVERKIFSTSIGRRYIKKLEEILQGTSTDKCLFCGKAVASNSVICSECLAKFQPQQPKEKPDPNEHMKKSAVQPKEKIVSEPSSKAVSTGKKPKNKKKIIIVAVLLFALIGVFSDFSTSSNYTEILSMNKDEVDKIYGNPQLNASGGDYSTYLYPDGLCVAFQNDKAFEIALSDGSKEFFGLKVGDDIKTLEPAMEKNNFQFIRKDNNNGQVIYAYQNKEYLMKVFTSNNIILEINAMKKSQ